MGSGSAVSIPIGSPPAGRQHGVGRVRIVGADSIALSWKSTIEIVRWMNVVSVRSVRNHAEIVTRGRTLKARCLLRAIVTTLAEFDLVQIRRDVAVNGASVRRLIGSGRHRLILVLEGGACASVGREFQRDIRARFSGVSP
jgi:DNA-binding LytR/AlgR family response regulator